MDKKNLLMMLQKLNNQKIRFEGRLGELQNALNLTRDEYLKTVGQIDLMTSLLANIDSEEANKVQTANEPIFEHQKKIVKEEKKEE